MGNVLIWNLIDKINWLKLIHEWLRCVVAASLSLFSREAFDGWALFLTLNLTLVCLWAISRSTFPRRRPKLSWKWVWVDSGWGRLELRLTASFGGWIFRHVKIKSGLRHFVFIGVIQLMVEKDEFHSQCACWLEWMMISAVLHYNYNFIIEFRLKQNDSIPIARQTFYFCYVSGRLQVKPH